MKKSEIKESINSIKEAVKIAKDNLYGEILEPYRDIEEKLEDIQCIETDSGIETGIDFEVVLADSLRSCLENNGDIEEINNRIEDLISDLELWQEEASEKKQEQIQEDYIDIINEIHEILEIDAVECPEDIETQLDDMLGALEDMMI